MTLRGSLIRLAHADPSLRSHLLPLLKSGKTRYQEEMGTALPRWRDKLKEYSDLGGYFLHFSTEPKMGLNPKNVHDTPTGFYAYPLNFRKIARFARSRPYMIVFKPGSSRLLEMKTYGEADYKRDLDKLRDKYAARLDPNLGRWEDMAVADTYAAKIWNVTRMLANERVTRWTMILLKVLGYDGVVDDCLSIIYEQEPCQAVFFSTTKLELVTILQKDEKETTLTNTNFIRHNLTGKNLLTLGNEFRNSKFTGANLSGAGMSNIPFTGSDFSNANMSGVTAIRSNFEKSKFTGADLSGSDFSGSDFSGSDLSGVNMSGATLKDGKLYRCGLTKANLSNAVLTGTDMYAVTLNGANLNGADLSGSRLWDAGLSESTLVGANLTGANMKDADLRGADLTGANLTGVDLSNTHYDNQTKWPEGVTPNGRFHLPPNHRWASGVASELSSRMADLLSQPLVPATAKDLGTWIETTFHLSGSKTPKGAKAAKANLVSLVWYLKNGVSDRGNSEAYRPNIEAVWSQLSPTLAITVRLLSDEGDRVVPKQMVVGDHTYLNLIGFDQAKLAEYVEGLEGVFAEVKGWRRKAFAGGLTVALAGPGEFRGTAGGVYRSGEDTLYVRATPNVLKRTRGTYGALDYILVHELGHRYERKLHPREDFDQPRWASSKYSRKEGEGFAELFAISNFGIQGTWDNAVIDRFETLMTGGTVEEMGVRELPPHLRALLSK